MSASMPMTFRLSLFGDFCCCQLTDAILNELFYQKRHSTFHDVRLAKLSDLNINRFQRKEEVWSLLLQ